MQIFDRQRSLFGPVQRRVVVGLALAAVLALGLLAAGCGGSSAQGVAQVGTTETTTTESGSDAQNGSSSADPAAYSACMRKNGVPKFPDPDSDGRIKIKEGPGAGIDPDSAQFRAAGEACKKLAPPPPTPAQLAEDREQFLKFSACMRDHGLPKFPDPTSDGISLSGTGLNPNSPKFKEAEKACEDQLP